jgi:uncharacterized protein
MPRAIDFHVHSSTEEWLGGSLGPMRAGTQKFFRTEVRVRTAEEMAAEYAAWDLLGVLLAWDAETATGLPPLTNDRVAEICNRFPEQFVGFASVDPYKGSEGSSSTPRCRPSSRTSRAGYRCGRRSRSSGCRSWSTSG